MCEKLRKRRRTVKTILGKKMIRVARRMTILTLVLCLAAGSAFAASTTSRYNGNNYTHNSRYNGQLVVNGVDVSTWQSKYSNWKKAKADGVDFAILRVTWSGYGRGTLKTRNDDTFEKMYKNAKAAGVMRGVYVFSQAKNASEGIQEADFAVKRLQALGIGPKDLNLPVYMDYEFAGGRLGRLYGLQKTDATNAAAAFCNRIKAYGYTPGIYASTSFFNNYIDRSKLASDVDIWCAQYYSRCQYGGRYSKWQYASNGKVNGLLSYLGYRGNIDVNFWYIKKKVNSNPIAVIKGRTTLSVKDAKNPKFKITVGNTTLKQGVDYNIGGIRNNRKGTGYAYIKGIGKYGGYALVPLKITNKSSGSTTANLNKKCANYLTYASKAKSKYIGSGPSTSVKKITYKKGKTYTIATELNIRKGAGTNYDRVLRSSLSANMKKKTFSGTYAVLKPGQKVKCLAVKNGWIQISGGWICTGQSGEVYVK